MLVDGDSEPLLGLLLSDDVVVEKLLDLNRLGERRTSSSRFLLLIIGDDLVAYIDAFVADVNRRSGNQLLDLVLRFAAKRAAQCIVASSHPVSNLTGFYSTFSGGS